MASETDIPLPGFLPDEPASDGGGSSGPSGAAAPAPEPEESSGGPGVEASPAASGPAAAFSERLTARLREHESAQRTRWQSQVDQWRQDVAGDPELGGDNLTASVARAQLALDRFDQDKSIGRLLEQSGYGNHPAVIRFFNRMADALMEDTPAPGRPGGDLMPLEERMYAGWSSSS